MGFWSDMEEQGSVPAGITSRGPALQVHAPQATTAAAKAVLADNANAIQEATDEIHERTEVEKRLRMANYYRAIIDQPMFDDSEATDEALEVEFEMREFAMKRLKILMGMELDVTVQPPSSFSPQQEFALKILADNVLAQPGVAEEFRQNASVKKPNQAPQVATVPQPKPVPMAAPKLRTVTTAAPTLPDAPVKRGRGRPPGTGKHQIAAAQGKPAEKKFVEKIVEGPNGQTQVVKLDVSGPVQPAGLQKAPPPVYSPNMLSQADQLAASHVDNLAQQHPVMQAILKGAK